jgi:hypothetical protein
MRLIATTAFKGTMSPLQAARYLAHPGDRLLPLSDGGDGFIECLHHGLGGDIKETPAADPFGRIRGCPCCCSPTAPRFSNAPRSSAWQGWTDWTRSPLPAEDSASCWRAIETHLEFGWG